MKLNGLTRNMLYNIYQISIYSLYTLGMTALITLIMSFQGGRFSLSAKSVFDVFPIYFGFVIAVSQNTTYIKNIIGFNSTRKDFFVANIISSVYFAAITSLLFSIFGFIIPSMNIEITVVSFLSYVLAYNMGSFMGALIFKLGRIGFYIYIGCCAIFGGIIGFSISMSSVQDEILVVSNNDFFVITILIAVSVLLGIFSWLIIRKQAI